MNDDEKKIPKPRKMAFNIFFGKTYFLNVVFCSLGDHLKTTLGPPRLLETGAHLETTMTIWDHQVLSERHQGPPGDYLKTTLGPLGNHVGTTHLGSLGDYLGPSKTTWDH